MNILKVICFAVAAMLLLKLVSNKYADLSSLIRLAACAVLICVMATQIKTVFNIINDLAMRIGMADTYFNIVMKVIAIAYVTEFGSQLCKDAGENSIADAIGFAGKVIIFTLAVPVMLALIDMIGTLI